MRHKSFRIGHLQLNGVPVDLQLGDLVVAHPEAARNADWEIVLSTRSRLQLQRMPYDVHMETADGQARQLWGPGVLVRSDGFAHVFRGGGPLDGLRPGELED
ncbi:MAG: hypothetical protein S0880_36075 [Actinomycetota bacterium]|nr:hypothetical protein [Actinomycetota bacterium]